MKKIIAIILGLWSCAYWLGQSATVTGSLKNADNSGYYGYVTFTTLTTPLYDSPDVVLGPSVRTMTDTNGAFTITLRVGNYRVTATNQVFSIAVPDTALTYDVAALVTGGLNNFLVPVPGTAVVTTATASALGVVRTRTTQASPVTMTTNDFNVKNVLWYGVSGDGVTDDTAAINALATNAGAYYFPKGTYLIDTLTGITPVSNTSFTMDPEATFRKTVTTNTASSFFFNFTYATNVLLQGGTFIGAIYEPTGTAQGAASDTFILASSDTMPENYYATNWNVVITGGTGSGQSQRCGPYNATTKTVTLYNGATWSVTPDATSTYRMAYRRSSQMCFNIAQGNDITFRDIVVRDMWGDGIRIDSAEGPPIVVSKRITVQGCTFSGCYRNNASIIWAQNVKFQDCFFINSHGAPNGPCAGIDLEANEDMRIEDVSLVNCHAIDNAWDGFVLASADTHEINRVSFVGCVASGNGWDKATGSGFLFSGVGLTNVAMVACTVTNSDWGLYLNKASHVQVSDSSFLGCTYDGAKVDGGSYITFSGSRFVGNGRHGILITAETVNDYFPRGVIVTGCHIENNTEDGINAAYSEAHLIANNRIFRNVNNGIEFGLTGGSSINGNLIVGNGYGSSSGYHGVLINGNYNNVLGNTVRKFMVWNTGTAAGTAADSITLATGAVAVDDYYNGMIVEITAGTGVGQKRIISDYNGTSLAATVSTNWSPEPSGATYYVSDLDSSLMGQQYSVRISSGTGNRVQWNDYVQGGTVADTGTGTVGLMLAGTYPYSTDDQSLDNSQIVRESSSIIEIRDPFAGSTAHTLRIYNTRTSGSVYERARIGWGGNIFYLGTEQLGAANREMRLMSASGNVSFVSTSSDSSKYNIIWGTDPPESSVTANIGSLYVDTDATAFPHFAKVLTSGNTGWRNVVTSFTYQEATEPDIPNDSVAFWRDSDDGKIYLIHDFGGTQKKVELP